MNDISTFIFDIQEIKGMNICDNFIKELKSDLSGTNLEYNIEIEGGSMIVGGGIFDTDKLTYPYAYYKYLMDGISNIFRKPDTESDEKRGKMNELYNNMISQEKMEDNIEEKIENNIKKENITIIPEENAIPKRTDDYYHTESIEDNNINEETIVRIILNIKGIKKSGGNLREYKKMLERIKYI